MPPTSWTVLLLWSALAQTPSRPREPQIAFPAGAGVVNVRDFGARGDGRHDDTTAIQKAIDASAGGVVFLPAGTYRLSDTLTTPPADRGADLPGTTLQGQGQGRSTIRLSDGCPGFDDPARPKPVIWTGHRPASRSGNAVRDLTVQTGRRNPGAVGLRFSADGQGTVRDVAIVSGDGQAVTGLDLTFAEANGPLLVKNARVTGFDYGIRTARAVDSMTFEGITLENQRRFGLVNEGQCVSLRGLTSRNAGPALVNARPEGLVAILDSRLVGTRGALAKPGMENSGILFARGVEQVGYREAIHNAAGSARATPRKVEEFVSHPIFSLFPSTPNSLGLPIRETPEAPWDSLEDWASPAPFGGHPDDEEDDTAAIQSAVDSGKPTIYLPRGRHRIAGTLHIRGAARRVIGLGAVLEGKGTIRVEDGAAPVVVLERLWSAKPSIGIEHTSPRTLSLRDCTIASYSGTGRGDIFLEDVRGVSFRFDHQSAWARQLDVRPAGSGPRVVNDGGTLWVLGLTAEGGETLVSTRGGGKTELLGGVCLSTSDPKSEPMFAIDESEATLTIGESAIQGQPFGTLVRETRGGQTKSLARDPAPRRGEGSLIPLFTGRGRGR